MILKQEVIESPKERLMVSVEMRMVYINIAMVIWESVKRQHLSWKAFMNRQKHVFRVKSRFGK